MKQKVPRKLRWFYGPLGVLVIAVILLGGVVVAAQTLSKNSKTDTLQVNGRSFSLEVAQTQQARELGLGKRASMPVDHGMLFVFSQVQPECFWMKDMHFPLDIIWVSSNKQIVHIEHSVSPSSYPNSFCPIDPVKYVIELNAGMAATTNMHDGQTLDF